MKKKNEKMELIILGLITIVLLIALILSGVYLKKDKNIQNNYPETENKETESENKNENHESLEEENEKEDNSNIENNISNNQNNNSNSNNNNYNNNNNAETDKSNQSQNSNEQQNQPPGNDSSVSSGNNSSTNNNQEVKNEEEVISYFTSLNTNIETMQNEDDLTFRQKAKNTFTTVVDFLFYGDTIKGYTFKELTATAKLKVIKIALSIDNKIDSYFPNYKDTIKEKMTNLKGKAALLYLETTAKLCEKVGSSACNEARVDFKNMKESFGFTWEIIKEAGTNSYASLKTILNEWYQSIKD